jgi:hypothetical protein
MVRKIPRNFIAWNRSWVTVRHHLPIILKPAAVGIAMLLMWKFVFLANGMYFTEHAKEPILFIILPLVGFIYVIFASIAVGSVFDQYRKVSSSVVRKDVDTFLLYRDEQLPILMHILIGAPSIIIIVTIMLFNYGPEHWVGALAVFAVSFMLTLIWVIATELDDFHKSIWFRQRIPREWYEIDIETHFSAQNKKTR